MRILAVLLLELARAARRERTYWMRTVYVAFLATIVALNWITSSADARWGEQQESVGRSLFMNFAYVQFILINLAAPVFLCGAISEERNRGTLPVLLSTQLSGFEIVLGKLMGGLVPVFLLLASGVPIMFLLLVFGGLGPVEVLSAFGLTLVCAIFGASAALFFSTLVRAAYVSLGMTLVAGLAYTILPHLLLDSPSSGNRVYMLLRSMNWYELHWIDVQISPFLGFPWVLNARDTQEIQAAALGGVFGLLAAGGFLLLTALPLRWSEARGGGLVMLLKRFGRGIVRIRFLRPPGRHDGIDWNRGNPILLRETGGILSSLGIGLRYAMWGALPVVAGVAILAGQFFPNGQRPVVAHDWALPLIILSTLVLPLIAGAQAFTREKENNAFTILLASPLCSESLVTGKLLAVLLPFLPVALLPVGYVVFFVHMGSLESWLVTQVIVVQLAFGAWIAAVSLFAGLLMRKRTWALALACAILLGFDLASFPLWVMGERLEMVASTERAFLFTWLLPIRRQDLSVSLWRDFAFCAGFHLISAGLLLLYTRNAFNRLTGRCP